MGPKTLRPGINNPYLFQYINHRDRVIIIRVSDTQIVIFRKTHDHLNLLVFWYFVADQVVGIVIALLFHS